ncbi:hypothetical protein BJ742DRAFT_94216 [Cladochytrium replicatum]|nr:hypothetical protein BJ742DRAFT_94216 [Cladochytrium replicatum]
MMASSKAARACMLALSALVVAHAAKRAISKSSANTLAEIMVDFMQREIGFFNSTLPGENNRFHLWNNLEPSDALHYGEVALVLCGIKPCVLIGFNYVNDEDDHRMRPWRRSLLNNLADQYKSEVWDRWCETHHQSHHVMSRLKIQRISQIVSTDTARFDCTYCAYLDPLPDIVRQTFLDHSLGLPVGWRRVSDSQVAKALGYPCLVELDDAEDWLEVAWLDANWKWVRSHNRISELVVKSNSSQADEPILVTTFWIKQHDSRRSKELFVRARQATKGIMDLKYLERPPR